MLDFHILDSLGQISSAMYSVIEFFYWIGRIELSAEILATYSLSDGRHMKLE